MTVTLNTTALNSYNNKNISLICGQRYHNDDDAHCAHFVSHALGVRGYPRCGGRTGVSIRIDSLLSRAPWFRAYSSTTAAPASGCLIYVAPTSSVRVRSKRISAGNRHVGFLLGNQVWHYENRAPHDCVVSYPLNTVRGNSFFVNRYGSSCGLWISGFVSGATLRAWSAPTP